MIVIYIIIIIVLIVLTFLVKNVITETNKHIIPEKQIILKEFSSNIRIEHPQDYIDINNPYVCDYNTLRPCKIDDITSCFGCKELITKCTHFNDDIEYIKTDGTTIMIPKNESENDGYCLSVEKLADACNPYHGKFVLVQLYPDSVESMLICQCNNPGLIGNTDIIGNCTTPYICNGKIDDVNKPIKDINCICDNNLIPDHLNEYPYCRKILVNDDIDLNHLEFKQKYISKDLFAPNIAQNIKISNLISPCAVCPITGKPVNGIPEEHTLNDEKYITCTAYNLGEGVPFRRNKNEKLLRGDHGFDAVLNLNYSGVYVYFGLNDSNVGVNNFYYLGNKKYNKELFDILNITDTYAVFDVGHTYIMDGLTPMMYSDLKTWSLEFLTTTAQFVMKMYQSPQPCKSSTDDFSSGKIYANHIGDADFWPFNTKPEFIGAAATRFVTGFKLNMIPPEVFYKPSGINKIHKFAGYYIDLEKRAIRPISFKNMDDYMTYINHIVIPNDDK